MPKSSQAETDPTAAERAQRHLRAARLKVTTARTRVLAVLLGAERALTHAELERRLDAAAPAAGVDRVTLYRVLDDLLRHALVRRVAGSDRVWRFGRATNDGRATDRGGAADGPARPAQFECNRCGAVMLLETAGPRPGADLAPAVDAVKLAAAAPLGFRAEQIEVTVRGRCARCA